MEPGSAPTEKVDIFGTEDPAPCTENAALKECNVMCMCLLMVNRQVGLWSKIFPTTEGKYLRGDVKPLSQCELWRDKKHTAEPLTVESRCFDKCTIAEQYVLAAHGWDEVCAALKLRRMHTCYIKLVKMERVLILMQNRLKWTKNQLQSRPAMPQKPHGCNKRVCVLLGRG